MTGTNDTERLAWAILLTVNRAQAKGSTVRRVVPGDPEVARELEPAPSAEELLSAEQYLLDRGYVIPANIGLTWGTYTITPAGLNWLGRNLVEPPETHRSAAEEPGRAAEVPPSHRRRSGGRRETLGPQDLGG
jgi:hypothetical protein